jgi:hypothetical protein
MPQAIFRALLTLLVIFAAAGCAGLGKQPSSPQVTLANIRVQ